jgi:hemerythrin superfamily protein
MDRLLSDDHQAVAEILKQLLAALRNNDVQASYSKLDLMWARLAVHIRAEHLHLFPAVINCSAPATSDAESVVEQLRADHDFFMRKLAGAVNILRELREQPDSPERRTRLTAILNVVLEVESRLSNHNEMEENQIYRWANTLLTEPEQEDLAARINAELENRPPRFSVDAWANDL